MAMTTKPKHGGARNGAGRKPDDVQSKSRLVRIDDETAEIMRKLGDGNLSLGIRLAAQMLRK